MGDVRLPVSHHAGCSLPVVVFQVAVLATLLLDTSEAGSCFKIRLPNGRCHQLIQRNYISRSECCQIGGFYVHRFLTETQFVRDILLHRSGTDNCHYPCQSGMRSESCARVNCPAGYKCELQRGKAVCACSSICTKDDFESGPVCTTDFRQFRNRCSFMKERCRNQDVMLEEMECPPAEHVCPYKRNVTDVDAGDYELPVRICPRNQVCIVRLYSGKASCEDPNWLGRRRMKSTFDALDVNSLNSCANGQFRSYVCGTDNTTYTNQCHLRRASIRRGIEIRIAYMGPCRRDASCGKVRCQSADMICVRHVNTGQPVCLDCKDLPLNCNPQVFPSREVAEMTLFEMSKEAQQSFGDPRWHGDVFTNGWPYVCGSDSQSFPNACFLHVYNCLAKRYIDMVSTGSCPEYAK
uniref:Kazal-like domain-containing protein n=1 Tax=Mesocestoides corti TaxID=53468 RepID=A0A5K3FSG7_MESCO